MTAVGLIGSGHIGSTVARLAVAAGHQVVLSNSRGPETLKDLAAELGPLAQAATGAQAAASDIVVVTIPVKAYLSLPAGPLAGQVVIDTRPPTEPPTDRSTTQPAHRPTPAPSAPH